MGRVVRGDKAGVGQQQFEQAIMEAGIGDGLRAAFQSLRDSSWAQAGQQGPRFSRQCCRDLARVVVCRVHAPLMWELVHMVRLAHLCPAPMGWLSFFWEPGPAAPDIFRSRAQDAGGSQIHVEPQCVRLEDGHGGFAIAWTRMPLLTAMADLLCGTIGFAAFEDALAPVVGQGAPDFDRAAKSLSAAFHAYLTDQLAPAQLQHKMALLLNFLEDGDEPAIDDDTILAFWRAHCHRDADFRTFRSAFEAFAELATILRHDADRRALAQASPIGNDRDQGEIDPAQLAEQLEIMDRDLDPLTALTSPPASDVKFLPASRQEPLRLLSAHGETALSLPLSLLRCEVFGRAQNRLTQALRRQAGDTEIAALCRVDSPDYREQARLLDDLASELEQVALASLHVLRCVREGVENPSGPFIGTGEDPIRRQAEKAFKAINRQGFTMQSLASPHIAQAFSAGAAPLAALKTLLEECNTRLRRLDAREALDLRFARDQDVFQQTFQQLYRSGQ